jgi:REP element-mobilizing transposase RayT
MGLLMKASGTSIYAFALMTNHAHILLKSGPDGISTCMSRLLAGYAKFFNRRHQRVGHLFRNRYKSIICQEETYFTKLLAFIHLSPFWAGLVESLDQYLRCGHAVVMNTLRCDWMDREYVLHFFGSKERSALKASLRFLEEELKTDREKDLSGGGLVRSQGGWSNVQSLRRQGEKALAKKAVFEYGISAGRNGAASWRDLQCRELYARE